MKRTITAAIAALIIGSGIFGVTRAVGTEDPYPEDTTQAKLDAIAEATGVDPEEITTTALGELAAVANSGDALQILQIKTLLPLLLAQDVSVGQLPDLPLLERIDWVNSVVNLTTLQNVLKDVWVPGALQDRAAEWLNAIQLAAEDPTYQGYDLNTLVVTEWQGVTVDGDDASAVLLAHPRFHTSDGWVDDEDDQYQVKLKRLEGLVGLVAGWRLVSVDRVDNSDLGSTGDAQ